MARPKSDSRVLSGIARNVSVRDAEQDIQTFRLEQLDEKGNVLGYTVVECHAMATDVATDGDAVEVVGRLKQDGALLPRKLVNHTTGRTFNAPKGLYEFGFRLRDNPFGCLLAFAVLSLISVVLVLGLFVAFNRLGDPRARDLDADYRRGVQELMDEHRAGVAEIERMRDEKIAEFEAKRRESDQMFDESEEKRSESEQEFDARRQEFEERFEEERRRLKREFEAMKAELERREPIQHAPEQR